VVSDVASRWEERQFFAVRCCCQPTKVIGFLLLPKGGGNDRTIIDCNGRPQKIQIKTSTQYAPPAPHFTQYGYPVGGEPFETTVVYLEQAIYSEDRGEEFWLTIPGFVRIVTPEFVTALIGKKEW
jgi:hypothetical protein